MSKKIISLCDYKRSNQMKLTYAQLNSDPFNRALFELSTQKNFPNMKAAYSVAKLWRRFEKELGHARTLFTKFADAYYEKDEHGKPVMAEKPNGITPIKIIPEKEEEFKARVEEFLKLEATFDVDPLKIEDLEMLKLAPQTLLALEPIFDSSVFAQLSPSVQHKASEASHLDH